ncbi:MAG TPA: BON domain-containing protein [Terriglobia bacterium]|jgi:sporulation protein YlmC with PRC-barrel domain
MQKSNRWLATGLLHEQVRNTAGENLGKIEDIVVDPATGNIQYAVLSFGGVLGTGTKLFAVPWPLLRLSNTGDYIFLNVARGTLERAPGFDRDHWPDFSDPAWRRSIHDYYGSPAPVIPDRTAAVPERRVVVEHVNRARTARQGLSLGAGLAIIVLVVALGWTAFLLSTRGWEQTKQDMRSTLQNAAYAAKETSHDAALTTKVKTALALSKRIPSGQVDVTSEGNVVTLRGDVPSEEVRTRAESVAGDVPGVEDVQNHLFVTSQSR